MSKAIVLSSLKYKEDSAIITLAGENGVFALLARGIYKPKSQLKALLITGSLLMVEYNKMSKGFDVASSLQVIEDTSFLFQDYPSSCYLMYLSQLGLSLYHYGDAFPFVEMQYILKALEEKKDVLSLTLLTLGVIYHSLGLQINTHSCIECEKEKNIVSFSLKDGGFLCKDCYSQYGEKVKDKMDLFVLKYAFSTLDEQIINKKVPSSSGIRVLSLLHDNLQAYFDLKPISSFSLLLSALNT